MRNMRAELASALQESRLPQKEAVFPFPAPYLPAGADRQRKKLLKTVPIVGVTCCSSMLAALDNQQVKLVWRSVGRLVGPSLRCLVPVFGSGWALRWDKHSSKPSPRSCCLPC